MTLNFYITALRAYSEALVRSGSSVYDDNLEDTWEQEVLSYMNHVPVPPETKRPQTCDEWCSLLNEMSEYFNKPRISFKEV